MKMKQVTVSIDRCNTCPHYRREAEGYRNPYGLGQTVCELSLKPLKYSPFIVNIPEWCELPDANEEPMRTMKTAPKDGTDMLIFDPRYGEWECGFWGKEKDRNRKPPGREDWIDSHGVRIDALGWLPLPPKPDQDAGAYKKRQARQGLTLAEHVAKAEEETDTEWWKK